MFALVERQMGLRAILAPFVFLVSYAYIKV
nr:MAG TPA: hypothetical protein [Caudoviricetes sp.]